MNKLIFSLAVITDELAESPQILPKSTATAGAKVYYQINNPGG